jgi:hypothetical protein
LEGWLLTSEIAVMNRNGVALAADSAVTLGSGKILVSGNKLFALSKYHPVGAMVFGNAEFMSLPWETVLKVYRSKLGTKSFATLPEYGENLMEFLRTLPLPCKQETEELYVRGTVIEYVGTLIWEARDVLRDRLGRGEAILDLDAEIGRIFGKVVQDHYKEWQSAKPLPTAPADYCQTVSQVFSQVIDKAIKDALAHLNVPVSATCISHLRTIAESLLCREEFVIGIGSGLVVAGYGEQELVPSLVAYDVQGALESVLKYREDRRDSCDQHRVSIVPFAQADMIYGFMEGIDLKQWIDMKDDLDTLFRAFPDKTLEEVGNVAGLDTRQKRQLRRRLQKVTRALYDDWLQRAEQYRQLEHRDPVLRMVEALAKDELAIMAETLVNLTSFKRRFTTDTETVGGATDVAVISKGDGFVWIKRKHYFPAELNHQFFANYHREADDEKA